MHAEGVRRRMDVERLTPTWEICGHRVGRRADQIKKTSVLVVEYRMVAEEVLDLGLLFSR